MRPLIVRAAVLSVGLVAAGAGTLRATEPPLTTVVAASGLSSPLYCTHAPGDYTRLFIVEKHGTIKILRNGSVLPTPFLNVLSLMGGSDTYLEYGLLSMCFHPNFAHNGYFYICYTVGNSSDADPVLARYRVSTSNPDVADPASARIILNIPYGNFPNHRSAWMDFGTDGYLYYCTGDGNEGDTQNNASNLAVLKGKILRLDVNGPDGVPGTADDDCFPADANKYYCIPPDNPFVSTAGAAPEIWAYGLRNPWRASFDRLTHDLYIADVGQGAREEIDFQPAGAGGRFYGWRCIEGTLPTGYSGCAATLPPSIPPIYEYPHSGGTVFGRCIIGGYVYRGCAIPELGGTYFFADYSGTGKAYSFRYSPATGVTNFTDRTTALGITGTTTYIASFGEDAYGEIYGCRINAGTVVKIVPTTFQGPDCNANGKRDDCDIASGASSDANGNGIPDECECMTCAGDTNGDHITDGADVQQFVACFGASLNTPGCRCANMNGDVAVDANDMPLFVDKLLGTTDPDPACP